MTIYNLGDSSPILPHNENYWIAPTASVIGKVRLAEKASIWFGAVLRGDNELIDVGEGTNIQDGTICHTDPGYPLTLGPNCTIGHQAILHGCTVAENSLIGMGARLLNGVKIGKNSLVGAGSLIPEGKTFPDQVLLVGSPAKIIRELTDEEIKGLELSARRYQDNAKRFKENLKEKQD